MIEHAFAVFAYSRRTQLWLVLMFLFPLAILAVGAYLIGGMDNSQLPAWMNESLSARLLRLYDRAALFIGVGCLVEAVRSYRRDWKRY